MSIDRRIVSILYHNGIEDVNKVEKFIGENNNYYEIIIDGELKKLIIPGYEYKIDSSIKTEDLKQEIFVKDEFLEVEKSIKENKLFTVTEKIVEVEVEHSIIENLEKEEDFALIDLDVWKETNSIADLVEFKENKNEENVVVEPVVDKQKKEVKKEIKKEVKVEAKKEVKKTVKKIDNDIDDFINLA